MQDEVLNKEPEGEQDAHKARLGSGGMGVAPRDGVEAGKRAGSGAVRRKETIGGGVEARGWES
ncbi:unnamed protein product [Ectocarpus sp. 8 AP-2014]